MRNNIGIFIIISKHIEIHYFTHREYGFINYRLKKSAFWHLEVNDLSRTSEVKYSLPPHLKINLMVWANSDKKFMLSS